MQRADRLEKRDKKGVVHQLVDDATGLFKRLGVRRVWPGRDSE
jgi:hypothetical protein